MAIDGYPMCDPCLDDEDDVERMALAQCDSPASTNMIPVWVYDPDLPYDEVEKIKHCVCIMYATKFIPAGSRLSWYYPMVHHKVAYFPPPSPYLPCINNYFSLRLSFRKNQVSSGLPSTNRVNADFS